MNLRKLIATCSLLALSANVLALTDGEIAKTLDNVNIGEISMATMAKQKSKNPEVLKFADHMITDHKMNKEKSAMLLKKERITPQENPKAMEMDKEGMAVMNSLKPLSGNAFDAAYIKAQLDMHKKVLMTLDNEFIPAAQNKEYKTLLSKTRDTVSMHVDHAQKLSSEIK